MIRDMSLSPPPVSRYLDTLAVLGDALKALDELNEGIAAAHLCMVIEIISARVQQDGSARH